MGLTLKQVRLLFSETDKQGRRIVNNRAAVSAAEKDAETRATVNKNIAASLGSVDIKALKKSATKRRR